MCSNETLGIFWQAAVDVEAQLAVLPHTHTVPHLCRPRLGTLVARACGSCACGSCFSNLQYPHALKCCAFQGQGRAARRGRLQQAVLGDAVLHGPRPLGLGLRRLLPALVLGQADPPRGRDARRGGGAGRGAVPRDGARRRRAGVLLSFALLRRCLPSSASLLCRFPAQLRCCLPSSALSLRCYGCGVAKLVLAGLEQGLSQRTAAQTVPALCRMVWRHTLQRMRQSNTSWFGHVQHALPRRAC